MTLKLEVSPRENNKSLARAQGLVPGIVYGPKQEPIAISVPITILEKVIHEAGESTIINLVGLDKDMEVLVHEVAFNAEKGGVEHIDFYAIERGKELTVNVAIDFVGEAPAVKNNGSLTKVMHDIEVTCKPSLLPSEFTVDVSSLVDFESVIKVSDLKVPEGVKVNADADDVIALVSEVKEEEDENPEEVDMDAVEVEQKGGGEAEGEEEKS